MDWSKMTVEELVLFLEQNGKSLIINDGKIAVE